MKRYAKPLLLGLTALLAAGANAHAVDFETCMTKARKLQAYDESDLQHFCKSPDPAEAAGKMFRIFGPKEYKSVKDEFNRALASEPTRTPQASASQSHLPRS